MLAKRKIVKPTPAEDEAINAGIAADSDTYELSEQEFKQLRPLGRPAGSGKKVQITMRLDSEIVDAFRETGDGWETRMNDALRDWLATH
jgi:uncharacterized protein (DUF4415 family)